MENKQEGDRKDRSLDSIVEAPGLLIDVYSGEVLGVATDEEIKRARKAAGRTRGVILAGGKLCYVA